MTSIERQLQRTRRAASEVAFLDLSRRNAILTDLRHLLLRARRSILRANGRDFARLPASYPHADRLRLTPERISGMAETLRHVERLPDPLNQRIDRGTVPSGLQLERRTVPLGVIGVIYESRPNVTVEIVSLAIKSGNCIVLRGGRDAYETNRALVRVIHAALRRHGVTTSAVALLDSFRRDSTTALLRGNRYLDILIPRGSNRLIRFVREHSTVPVIETGAGVCHTYVERTANLTWAERIIVNAKTRRPTVCNALDTLVVDQSIAPTLFRRIVRPLDASKVKIFADPPSFRILRMMYPASLLHPARPAHFGKEFLSLKMSIKVVRNWREGIAFVQENTSGHSEAILTRNKRIAKTFQRLVDAAVVYVNTSTAFTDGYEFGLGAEVGISTQKLHARGPMALRELTTYKWFVSSPGAVRPR